ALHPPDTFPTYAMSNHDQSRLATRWGSERARAAAFLLLTLRGVAVLYAGEEIGMVDADPDTLPHPPFDRAGRDGYRTPMQWDATLNGGFTGGTPWLPLVDPTTRNVAAQSADPGSLLNLYRRLLQARRASPALAHGAHRSLFGVGTGVLAWMREADDDRVLVLLNAGDGEAPCRLPVMNVEAGAILVATTGRAGAIDLDRITLVPHEGIAIRL
ncbi:MAG: alpha-amylase family glycosyl hydrolase, partial [Candidatus Limnocylindria bacterium]